MTDKPFNANRIHCVIISIGEDGGFEVVVGERGPSLGLLSCSFRAHTHSFALLKESLGGLIGGELDGTPAPTKH